jgi:hypothetical protein
MNSKTTGFPLNFVLIYLPKTACYYQKLYIKPIPCQERTLAELNFPVTSYINKRLVW